jgi:hypothetical protein
MMHCQKTIKKCLYLDRLTLPKRSTKYLVFYHFDYDMDVSAPQ